MQDFEFIREFGKIKISDCCKSVKVDMSNIYNKKTYVYIYIIMLYIFIYKCSVFFIIADCALFNFPSLLLSLLLFLPSFSFPFTFLLSTLDGSIKYNSQFNNSKGIRSLNQQFVIDQLTKKVNITQDIPNRNFNIKMSTLKLEVIVIF